jgi:DNA-binding transcriptional MerR regulator
MAKSPDAFRTISEVSDWLDTPAHVLRFWESKFSQIKPVKRAGGRRYYRPQDMALLGGIKKLLHEEGMTIKGVQKLLKEKGVKFVAALGPSPNEPAPAKVEPAAPAPSAPKAPPKRTPPEVEAVLDEAEDDSLQGDLFGAFDLPKASNVVSLHPQTPSGGPLAAALDGIKADPKDSDFAGESRFYAGYFRASQDKLIAQADAIQPLVARLAAVQESLSRD